MSKVHYTSTSTTLLKQLKITVRAPAGQNGPVLSRNQQVLLEVLICRTYLYKDFSLGIVTLKQQYIHTICVYSYITIYYS